MNELETRVSEYGVGLDGLVETVGSTVAITVIWNLTKLQLLVHTLYYYTTCMETLLAMYTGRKSKHQYGNPTAHFKYNKPMT